MVEISSLHAAAALPPCSGEGRSAASQTLEQDAQGSGLRRSTVAGEPIDLLDMSADMPILKGLSLAGSAG